MGARSQTTALVRPMEPRFTASTVVAAGLALVGLVGLIALASSAWAGPAAGALPSAGKVIEVADGDTLTVMDAKRQRHTIRLADIDAPETCKARGRAEDETSRTACNGRPGQPFSDKARIALRSMTIGQDAHLRCREPDRYGRSVCRVFVGSTDVNAELVRRGLAWYETRHGRDRRLHAAWQDAMRQRVGLFADPLAVPPSAWRRYCWGEGVCQPRQILEMNSP